MIWFLGFLLFLSLLSNGILVWYTRKLIRNINLGITGVDQFQQLLDEYCKSMEAVYQLEQYYGDTTIETAIKNTKMIVEASKFYKRAVLDVDEEEPPVESQEEPASAEK
jgi:hypothetical protein